MYKQIFKLKDVAELLSNYPSTTIESDILPFEKYNFWLECFVPTLNYLYTVDIMRQRVYENIKGCSFDETLGEYILDELGTKIFNKVYQRYFDWVAFEIDIRPYISTPDSIVLKKLQKFIVSFINIYNNTYDKYSKLNSELTTYVNKLISGKSSSASTEASSSSQGRNKFNDTPQNNEEYDYEEEIYMTNLNISKASGSSESETTYNNNDKYPIELLEMLEQKYIDLMLKWSNEFARLFTPTRLYEDWEEEYE